MKNVGFILTVLMILPFMTGCGGPEMPDYWPTEGWRTSTPEEQNIDATKLNEGIEEVIELDLDADTKKEIENSAKVIKENIQKALK